MAVLCTILSLQFAFWLLPWMLLIYTCKVEGLVPLKITGVGVSHRFTITTLAVTVVGDGTDHQQTNEAISYDLIRSLDLSPLLIGISNHCATLRGRQSLLSIVGEADFQQRPPRNVKNSLSSKRRRVMEPSLYSSTQAPLDNTLEKNSLAPIACSSTEARAEYELVEQALLALQETNEVSIPPLYGTDSSPWDTATPADTDDDEWLLLPIDLWTLEHVLQADKVVEKLLKTKRWADQDITLTWVPGLSAIGRRISTEILEVLSNEIEGSVEIVRHRSLADPRGNRSFTFRLNADKFPLFQELYCRELKLVEEIDKEIAVTLRKQKGSNEALEFQGRRVLSVPKSTVSPNLGIIRGKSETGGRSYVEPHRIVALGNELAQIRNKLEVMQKDIELTLIQSIQKSIVAIDEGLQALARLDTVFARAAFGSTINGVIPRVGQEGKIDVKGFIHPVLAVRGSESSVVPIDLFVSRDEGSRALIISGPNGGGKTIALKSFGLACIMCKLAIPFPTVGDSTPRADFFEDVLVQVGDSQSVIEGESTLLARLNAIASIINQMSEASAQKTILPYPRSSMILLDELGSGTDPSAGAAIAQAVLENMLENKACRVVATTHSPQLKALSLENDQFNCASVMLENRKTGPNAIQMPTFQLRYGLIGDSCALGAAFRCNPSLPEDILSRAASLMSAGISDEGKERISLLTLSLEQHTKAAEDGRILTDQIRGETTAVRNAMLTLAKTYDRRLKSLEQRLESCFQALKADETMTSVDLVGETLLELRVLKKAIKSEADLLTERGLKIVSDSYEFTDGESVIILAKGAYEGDMGKVTLTALEQQEDVASNEVLVFPSWGSGMSSWDFEDAMEGKPLVLKRHEIAFFDYESAWNDSVKQREPRTVSIRESQRNLFDKLSMMTSNQTTNSGEKATKNIEYTSARQRKAAKSKKTKKKKK